MLSSKRETLKFLSGDCMYLGNLAGGGGAVNASKVASGLDKIMSEIKGGTSMEDALKKYTKYQSLSDFENNFANDAASFVHNLVTAVGNGSGGPSCAMPLPPSAVERRLFPVLKILVIAAVDVEGYMTIYRYGR